MKRDLAPVAQRLYRQEVTGVEHRRHHAERVARKPGGRELEAGVDKKYDASERRAEAGEEHARGPLPQKDPRRECHENRREVGEQGGVRHRGELDRLVPEGEVPRERKRGAEEQRRPTEITATSI